MDEDADEKPEFTAYTTATASTRDGELTVTTTELGFPLGLRVDGAQLRRDPQDLAASLLSLCKQAAHRAGLLRRQELAAQGVTPAALDLLKLPKPEDVQRAELIHEAEREYEPRSWMEQG